MLKSRGWLLVLLFVPVVAAAQLLPPDFRVPGALVDEVEVPEDVWSNGVPTRLRIARSSWKVDDLFRHYYRLFEDAGLYIPPERQQVSFAKSLQLTGVDVDKDRTFTLLLRPMPDGTTDVVFGQADFRRMRVPVPAEDEIPLPPAAQNAVRSRSEDSWTVAFEMPPDKKALFAHYDRFLNMWKYKRAQEGIYVKGEQEVRILAKADNGRLRVLVSKMKVSEAAPHTP